MTSSNGNIFRVTGPLCGEFTGHRWIPLTKASDTELRCFFWSAPEINGWTNNLEAGDLRRHRGHYVVTVMILWIMHAVVFSLASFYKIRCIFGAETNIIAWSSSYILVYKRCGIGQNFRNLTWIYENRSIIISYIHAPFITVSKAINFIID